MSPKQSVKQHWEQEVCGTRYGESYNNRKSYFQEISDQRYRLENYILDFAQFSEWSGKRTLEIGLGTGSDFYNGIIHGAQATGFDLTKASVKLTRERLVVMILNPKDTL